MIAEIIFSVIIGVVTGYIIYRFLITFDRRKMEKNVVERMEDQESKSYNIGGNIINFSVKELGKKPKDKKSKKRSDKEILKEFNEVVQKQELPIPNDKLKKDLQKLDDKLKKDLDKLEEKPKKDKKKEEKKKKKKEKE